MLPQVDFLNKTCFHEAGHVTFNTHIQRWIEEVWIYYAPHDAEHPYDGRTETHSLNKHDSNQMLSAWGVHQGTSDPCVNLATTLASHFGGIIAEIMQTMQRPWEKDRIIDRAINPAFHEFYRAGQRCLRDDFRFALDCIQQCGDTTREKQLLHQAASTVYDFHAAPPHWTLLTDVAHMLLETYAPTPQAHGEWVSILNQQSFSPDIRTRLQQLHEASPLIPIGSTGNEDM